MSLVELATAIEAQKGEITTLTLDVVTAEATLDTIRKEHQEVITTNLALVETAVNKLKDANQRLHSMYGQMSELIAVEPPQRAINDPSDLKRIALDGQKYRNRS